MPTASRASFTTTARDRPANVRINHNKTPGKVAAIGECMAEIRLRQSGEGPPGTALDATIGYGGDTLNFAVYLARQGIPVDYVTGVGSDPLSDKMLSGWRNEGVGCDFVWREEGGATGLYLIDVDAAGEPSFHYWRAMSPASRLLADADRARALFRRLANHLWLYLTGITLAIYPPESRARLLDLVRAHRGAGGKVAFDGNYRPRLWPRQGEAADVYERMYRQADLALSTLDDERQLFGEASERAVADRLRAWGVKEIALKKGAAGCAIADRTTLQTVPAAVVADVVDTTAAGDSFNAGYLAARLRGRPAHAAALLGNQLAAQVVRHPGAIIPADPS